MSDPAILRLYIGKYAAGGANIEVVLKNDNSLYLLIPGQPQYRLVPYKAGTFRMKDFADITMEFMMDNGKAVSLRQHDPSGVYELKKLVEPD